MTQNCLSDQQRSTNQEIVLFHSLLGLRRGVLQWADKLRDAGYTVHTPDLYDGEVFDDSASAARKLQGIGFDELIARSRRSVSDRPAGLVYAGFSNGGAFSELLAATRPGARGAILMHAPLPIRPLGWKAWPATVPVQVHFSERDPLRSQDAIDKLAHSVCRSGATFEEYNYPGSGHLFADPDLPDFDAAASDLMFGRILELLGRIAMPAKSS
jgi:dienelactone hydrolase